MDPAVVATSYIKSYLFAVVFRAAMAVCWTQWPSVSTGPGRGPKSGRRLAALCYLQGSPINFHAAGFGVTPCERSCPYTSAVLDCDLLTPIAWQRMGPFGWILSPHPVASKPVLGQTWVGAAPVGAAPVGAKSLARPCGQRGSCLSRDGGEPCSSLRARLRAMLATTTRQSQTST